MHPTIQPIPTKTIPSALTERRQWVLWRAEIDGKRVPLDTDKARKVPYQINGNRASSTNPQQWATFDAVVKRYARGGYDGIGYVFSKDDPFVGIDLDDCINEDGLIHQWAVDILNAMPSYAEISPSGKGIKLWVVGSIPASAHPSRKDIPESVIPADAPGLIEMYSQERYFTVTGNPVELMPSEITTVNGELTALWQSLQKPAKAPEKPIQPLQPSNHTESWIDRVIERGRDIVASAVDGNKHNTRIRAAKLLGGLVAHGVSEDEIINILYDANPPSENLRGELKAIRDGIEYGKSNPLEAPRAPVQPIMHDGVAYCPNHQQKPLQRAKNGNGYKCHVKVSGDTWCDYWWQGDGYDMQGKTLPIDTADTITMLSSTAKLLSRSFYLENEIDQKIKPPTFLVKKYIALGEVTVVYGPSDSGKSTIVVDMVCRINQYARTLYIAGEDTSGVKAKRGAWLVHHNHTNTNGNFFIRDSALDLSDDRAVWDFITEMHPYGIKAFIFDTLSQCSGGADENTGMQPIMANLQKIAHELNAAVIAIHHTGKSGEYRGDSKIKANSYGFIHISQENDLIKMECDRIKNTAPFQTRYFRFVTVQSGYADADNTPITAPVPEPAHKVTASDQLTKPQIKILELLFNQPDGAQSTQLLKDSALTGNAYYVPLKQLRDRGFVGKRGHKHTDPLVITDAGRAELERQSDNPETDSGAVVRERNEETFEINVKVTLDTPKDTIDSNSDNGVWKRPENTTSYRDAIGYDDAPIAHQEADSAEILSDTIDFLSDTSDSSTDTISLPPSLDGGESIVSTIESNPKPSLDDRIDWPFCRQADARKDHAAIRTHATMHRTTVDYILSVLDRESGKDLNDT